jgi:calcium-dependent protein kinase
MGCGASAAPAGKYAADSHETGSSSEGAASVASSCTCPGDSAKADVDKSSQGDKKRESETTVRHQNMIMRHAIGEDIDVFFDFSGSVDGHLAHVTTVRRAKNRETGRVRAVRDVEKATRSNESVEEEIAILRGQDHPNIVNVFEVFEDAMKFYIVVDFCTGSPLLDAIADTGAALHEVDVACTMHQVFAAIHHLHERGICHRDIRPEVLMAMEAEAEDDVFGRRRVRIVSLDLACWIPSGGRIQGTVGKSFRFSSPQMLQGDYDKSCDMWSAGVLQFLLLHGRLPFDGRTDADVRATVLEGNVEIPDLEAKSKSKRRSAKLTQHLLTVDEEKRCNSQRALDNDFIKHSAQAEREKVDMSIEQLNNVHKFYRQNGLKKTALSVISRMLSEDELLGLRATFDSIDGNLDGVITYSELSAAINKQFNDGDDWHEEKQKKVRQRGLTTNVCELLKMMDADGDSSITYSEFMMATMGKKLYEEEALMWSAFKKFDKDASGKICRCEIQHVLGDVSLTCTTKTSMDPEAIAKIIAGCDDGDKDGEIDFEEFVAMMRKQATGGCGSSHALGSRGGGWKAEAKRDLAEQEAADD